MKKRILSFALACILVFSTFPAISAESAKGTKGNPCTVASYQEFEDFLENASSQDEAYCQLTADITVPDSADAIGGYAAKNVYIDGNGHTVSGLKIKDALFSTFTHSTIRNIVFDSAVVESTSSEKTAAVAVIAQSVEDKTSNITGCVFNNCKITLPAISSDAAFVAVKNQGVVTNCVVSDTSSVENTSQSTAQYRVGGITVDNISGSKVINCVSKMTLNFNADSDSCTFAGITVSNKGKVDLCYVNSPDVGENYIVADSSSTGNSSYLRDDDCYVSGRNNTVYYKEQTEILAAEMSQNAMNYVSNYDSTLSLAEADYPVLWCVNGGEPALSFDLKTAQVYLIVDQSLNDAGLEFSLGAEEVSVSSGKKFSLAVGEYQNDEYKRNTLNITYTCKAEDYQMINHFVYAPAFKYLENIINPYDGENYHKNLIGATQNGVENTASVELLPYCWKLSISNTSERDELVDYTFSGKGTESSPYTINNAYELTVLSHYVSEGKVSDSGLAYNSAYYTLETDLKDITINPIGIYSASGATAFKGSFDGKSHTISNLTVVFDAETNENDCLGLFGYVLGGDTPAVIKNLNVVSASADTSGSLCGIIAGSAQNAEINGCVTSGTASGSTQVAGIVGYANRSKIYNCGSTASLTTNSTNASAGGIVGYSEYTNVRNCYYSGTITANNVVENYYPRIGGITGYIENSTFDNCYYSTADISFVNFGESLSGISVTSDENLKSDEFLAQLKNYSSRASFGTLWGKDSDSINSGFPVNDDSSLIEYSVICVPNLAGTVSADVETARKGTTVTLTVNSEYDLKELQITNLNREKTDIKYTETEDGKYTFTMPAYSVRVVPVFDTEILLSGKGTEDDPYIIRNYEELNTVANNCYYNKSCPSGCTAYPYAYYEVANDIDCGGQTILPMGNKWYPFNGHFDGNGYTISNLKPSPDSAQVSNDYAYPAVFGYCGSAEIHDLTLQGIELSGKRSAVIASTVSDHTVIRNVTVKDCVISNASYGGGFVSQCKELTMVNCLADNIAFNNSSECGYLIWSVTKGVSLNNILVCNSTGITKLINSSNVTIVKEDNPNIYSSNTDISEESKLSVAQADQSKLSDKNFIAELSENAYYMGDDKVQFWGFGDSVEIAHENGVTGILPIYYDEVFSDPAALKMFEKEISAAEVNSTVEIAYNSLADLSNLRILTASGKKVGFTSTGGNGTDAEISFVMPCEPVYIGNSDVVPTVVSIPGSGTESDPYIISIPQQLQHISKVSNGLATQRMDEGDVAYNMAYFTVAADLDMQYLDWQEINYNFLGCFDGGDYIISNLNVYTAESINNGLFEAVFSEGKVCNVVLKNAYINSGTTTCYGAVARTNHGTVEGCLVIDSTINCSGNAAGVVGVNYSDGTVLNCGIANTTVNTTANNGYVSGVVGENSGVIENSYAYNCTFVAVSGNSYVSSILRENTSSTAPENCYYYTASSVNESFGTAVSKDDFTSGKVTYLLNGKKSNVTCDWFQLVDFGYPKGDYPYVVGPVVYYNKYEDKYTNIEPPKTIDEYIEPAYYNPETGVYEIANGGQLYWFSALVNGDSSYAEFDAQNTAADAVLVADINLLNAPEAMMPIGNSAANTYSGTFDGQGYTISDINLKINTTATGVFGFTSGTIKNLNVEGGVSFDNSKGSTTAALGGVIGVSKGGEISNVTIRLDYNSVPAMAKSYGGIVGTVEGETKISSCMTDGYFNVPFTVEYIGGIVGIVQAKLSVTNCANVMRFDSVNVYAAASGIVGYASGSGVNVERCFNYGFTYKDVSVSDQIAGGYSVTGKDNFCLIENNLSATNNLNAEFATVEQFMGGEIAYRLNQINGDIVWYQSLNENDMDIYPVLDSRRGIVVRNSDGTYSNYRRGSIIGTPGIPDATSSADTSEKSDSDTVTTGTGICVIWVSPAVALAVIIILKRKSQKVD